MTTTVVPFVMVVRFDNDGVVVVAVDGEVDLFTAPDLLGQLNAIVDQGHGPVALHLAKVDFVTAAGLGVIARIGQRLRASGGELTIRSASTLARQALEITDVSTLIRFEDGPAASPGPFAGPGDGVLDAALRLVVILAGATVAGADGVSITLNRRGHLMTVASSHETALRLDHEQYATGQGPCLAATTAGERFHIASLAEETRWPAFVSRASGSGMGSVLSTPLLVAARPVGALNMYAHADRSFGPASQELAALFAGQAAGVLAEAGADTTVEERSARLLDALSAREVIAQAQGVMMQRHGGSADAAAAGLHRWSRRADVPLRQHGADIVASTNEPNTAETRAQP